MKDIIFSLCHLNIRSLQANLNDFDMYLKSLGFELSCFGVSETWLHMIYMLWQVMHLLRDIDKPGKVVVLEYMSNMLFPSRLEMIYIHLMTILIRFP